MILVTGSVTGRPDTVERLRAAAEAHVARSRTEDGCISHEVAVDCGDAMRLVFLERWRDAEALRVHFRRASTAEFMAAVRALAEPESELDLYDAVPTRVA